MSTKCPFCRQGRKKYPMEELSSEWRCDTCFMRGSDEDNYSLLKPESRPSGRMLAKPKPKSPPLKVATEKSQTNWQEISTRGRTPGLLEAFKATTENRPKQVPNVGLLVIDEHLIGMSRQVVAEDRWLNTWATKYRPLINEVEQATGRLMMHGTTMHELFIDKVAGPSSIRIHPYAPEILDLFFDQEDGVLTVYTSQEVNLDACLTYRYDPLAQPPMEEAAPAPKPQSKFHLWSYEGQQFLTTRDNASAMVSAAINQFGPQIDIGKVIYEGHVGMFDFN